MNSFRELFKSLSGDSSGIVSPTGYCKCEECENNLLFAKTSGIGCEYLEPGHGNERILWHGYDFSGLTADQRFEMVKLPKYRHLAGWALQGLLQYLSKDLQHEAIRFLKELAKEKNV